MRRPWWLVAFRGGRVGESDSQLEPKWPAVTFPTLPTLNMQALLDTHIHYVQLLPSNADASLPTHYHPLTQVNLFAFAISANASTRGRIKGLGIIKCDAEPFDAAAL